MHLCGQLEMVTSKMMKFFKFDRIAQSVCGLANMMQYEDCWPSPTPPLLLAHEANHVRSGGGGG